MKFEDYDILGVEISTSKDYIKVWRGDYENNWNADYHIYWISGHGYIELTDDTLDEIREFLMSKVIKYRNFMKTIDVDIIGNYKINEE